MNYTDILNVLFKKISSDINDYSSLIFNIQKIDTFSFFKYTYILINIYILYTGFEYIYIDYQWRKHQNKKN